MSDFAQKLEAMTDAELIEETETRVWLSAYAGNNPRSKYHTECDACYDEARRRGKLWIYARGWNKAAASQGISLSESDLAAAREPNSKSE